MFTKSRQIQEQVFHEICGTEEREVAGKNDNYTISPRQASSDWYRKAIAAELDQGSDVNLEALATNRINHPEILAYKARILGNVEKTEHFADWTHFLVTDYGPRKRGLSLGSGLGRVENYLVATGFTEFETIELCAEVNAQARIHDDKVAVRKGDLNFLELPAETYDFILCHGVLHHLINLEYVLSEINQALKPDGLLLVYEYIGETRWAFSQERMDMLRAAFPGVSFRVPFRWELPGFESVRSGELLPLLKEQFGPTALRSVLYGGIYFPFVIATKPEADGLLKHVVALDEKVSKAGTLAPSYHMGLYGKSRVAARPASHWSDEDVKRELAPKTPLVVRSARRFKRTRLGSALRVLKRRWEGAG